MTNYPGMDQYGVVIGIALGTWLCVRKNKGKFFDWFDFIALGVSSGTSVFLAGLSILAFVWQYIVLAFMYLFVFIYFWNIEGKYRTFEWYRNKKTSAKSGFITGFSLTMWGILFLL